MVYQKTIDGKYVYLKSADVDDADFTLSLRKDPSLTRYLPKLDITVEQQKRWIETQRSKEGDYFFVVRRKDHTPIGTVSIYNVNGDTSESGRLALIGNAIENTEAALLLFCFAFDILHLKTVTGYTIDGNKRADRFNRQYGCVAAEPEMDENGEMIRRTVLTAEAFHEAELKLKKIIKSYQ